MEDLLVVLCAVRRPLFSAAKSETFAERLRSEHTTLNQGKDHNNSDISALINGLNDLK